jgi:hypothetical protein
MLKLIMAVKKYSGLEELLGNETDEEMQQKEIQSAMTNKKK